MQEGISKLTCKNQTQIKRNPV